MRPAMTAQLHTRLWSNTRAGLALTILLYIAGEPDIVREVHPGANLGQGRPAGRGAGAPNRNQGEVMMKERKEPLPGWRPWWLDFSWGWKVCGGCRYSTVWTGCRFCPRCGEALRLSHLPLRRGAWFELWLEAAALTWLLILAQVGLTRGGISVAKLFGLASVASAAMVAALALITVLLLRPDATG